MKVPKNRQIEVDYDGCFYGYYSTIERAQAKIDKACKGWPYGTSLDRKLFKIIDHRNGR